MPLVRIDVASTLEPARVAALSDSVHRALVTTAGVPPADRFHVLSRHDAGRLLIDPTFLGVDRGPEACIVSITFRRGRTDETKRALYRAIIENARGPASLRPEDIMIVLTENGPSDWSFGNGEAQYAPEPAAAS